MFPKKTTGPFFFLDLEIQAIAILENPFWGDIATSSHTKRVKANDLFCDVSRKTLFFGKPSRKKFFPPMWCDISLFSLKSKILSKNNIFLTVEKDFFFLNETKKKNRFTTIWSSISIRSLWIIPVVLKNGVDLGDVLPYIECGNCKVVWRKLILRPFKTPVFCPYRDPLPPPSHFLVAAVFKGDSQVSSMV